MKQAVDGLAALETALTELPKATQRNVLVRVGARALEPFIEEVKRLAPVDAASETPERAVGKYRDSWVISTKLNKHQKGTVRREGKSQAEVYAGTSDPVGVPNEFGTVERVQRTTGRSTGAVTARPHARPAWAATQSQVLGGVGEGLWDEIDKARARLARKAARGG